MEVLFISLIIGLIPAFIASSKGRSFFTWYVYGVLLFIVAIVHSIVIKPNEDSPGMKKCPACASIINKEARICPSCKNSFSSPRKNPFEANKAAQREAFYKGQRDVSDSSYQAYLAKKYKIEKVDVIDKYTVGEKAFDSVQDAINYLHTLDLNEEERVSALRSREEEKDKAFKASSGYVVEKGKIGPGETYDYTVLGDGTVRATHPSGFEKKFPTMTEAEAYFKN